MQCVILAAGRGTRMGDLCNDIPKPMLFLRGKPKLAYTIEMLPDAIDEVIIIVGYLKEKIIHYFGDTYKGKKIQYIIHEEIDGTGKILHSAKSILKERFLVIMGDDLYKKEDLENLMKYELAVLAIEVEDSSQFGVLKTDDQGNLKDILERPHDPNFRLVNTAAYMLTQEYFSYPLVKISQTEYGLPQTLVNMKDKNNIQVLRAVDWFPIGNPQALVLAQERIIDFI
ncbi:MAG: NTP transferase domain-containing protein [Candidatus Moraniibacteriota bacterium]|nr:MAG: NTP transferase domain-containing protein [Candidatus Moranbacteria bacterium]